MNIKHARRATNILILSAVLLVCGGASPAAHTGISVTGSASSLLEGSSEPRAELILAPVVVETGMVAPALGDDPLLAHLAEATWSYLSSDWATTNHLPWSWRSAPAAWHCP